MATIVTINASNQITNSRADINTNFSNLNSDKIETSVIDTDTTMAANSDAKIPSQKAVKTYIDTSGGANASETVRGIVEEATDSEVLAGTASGGTGAKLFITPAKLKSSGVIKFGGTGADGALSISTGTTDIDLGGVEVFVKDYTSISITGTGAITFSNPHANGTVIVLKSQGDVTITSSATRAIDLRSLGATGSSGGSNQNNSSAGTPATSLIGIRAKGGGGASKNGGSTGGQTFASGITLTIRGKLVPVSAGAGGSGGAGGGEVSLNPATAPGGAGGATLFTDGSNGSAGSTSSISGSGGAGGRGAGGLYIECSGALNITGTIDAAGAAGSNGTTQGGGGGGGAGGTIIILYNTLTANTGTYTVTAGGAGSGAGTGGAGGAGAAGTSLVAKNTEFI